jgi:rhodanese-related sulfurtransferase
MEELQISPGQFLKLLEKGEIDSKQIIDVREKMEWVYYHLEGSEHMPMNTIPERLEELPKDHVLYVICAHGVRSDMVCQYLHDQGFDQAINVQGGMAAVSGLRGFQYD